MQSLISGGNLTSCGAGPGGAGGSLLYCACALLVVAALALLCEGPFKACIVRIVSISGMGEDVAGATLLAAATSAPELFISLLSLQPPSPSSSSSSSSDSLGASAIVGSAIFNVCVIVGGSFLASPERVRLLSSLPWQTLARDLVCNLAAVLYVLLVFQDDSISWYEALIALLLYAAYIVFMRFSSRVIARFCSCSLPARLAPPRAPLPDHQDFLDEEDLLDEEMTPVHAEEQPGEQQEAQPPPDFVQWRPGMWRTTRTPFRRPEGSLPYRIWSYACVPFEVLFHYTTFEADNPTFGGHLVWVSLLVCLAYLALTTWLLIQLLSKVGCIAGMPEDVTGSTLLAVATSLPDFLTSVSMARSGYITMAVSNAFGSNVFDVFVALGVPWMVSSILQWPVVVQGDGVEAYSVIYCVALLVFAVSILLVRFRIKRRLGVALLGVYVLFLVYEGLQAGSVLPW